ncbi:MAG: prolyl oligopeptidase family serine peptidase, partial [Chloroflexota bacterium]|nr:prolyl oligopeptidase family serine peptidase [Chloroflexota bacterium]
YTSNIPDFDDLFLCDDPSDPRGRYITHSPIMHAGRVHTPALHITGALDRCTPPTQAIEFHRALLGHGVASELVIYPQEGHGVRHFPAIIDQCTRIVAWFERFMPAG